MGKHIKASQVESLLHLDTKHFIRGYYLDTHPSQI